mmetsp:Transcript_39830/g.88553  ORF Transcript_39830/g.88553 Transcript_39830/m.88553 type:complete len:102 (-) Transcript_39830:202-507(-)
MMALMSLVLAMHHAVKQPCSLPMRQCLCKQAQGHLAQALAPEHCHPGHQGVVPGLGCPHMDSCNRRSCTVCSFLAAAAAAAAVPGGTKQACRQLQALMQGP